MGLTITDNGLDQMDEFLAATEEEIRRAARNAVNQTATAARTRMVDRMRITGVNSKLLRSRMRIQRAQSGEALATVIPSSAGVPVTQYTWHAEANPDNTSRARLYVRWVEGGNKLAAGFLNQHASNPRPMSTRSSKGTLAKPKAALGPSVAAMFKVLRTRDFDMATSETLREKFRSALNKQMDNR